MNNTRPHVHGKAATNEGMTTVGIRGQEWEQGERKG